MQNGMGSNGSGTRESVVKTGKVGAREWKGEKEKHRYYDPRAILSL